MRVDKPSRERSVVEAISFKTAKGWIEKVSSARVATVFTPCAILLAAYKTSGFCQTNLPAPNAENAMAPGIVNKRLYVSTFVRILPNKIAPKTCCDT